MLHFGASNASDAFIAYSPLLLYLSSHLSEFVKIFKIADALLQVSMCYLSLPLHKMHNGTNVRTFNNSQDGN